MNIYAILASKPHNLHYLKRYHKFIISCQHYNQTHKIVPRSRLHPGGTYMERHHICPKAPDLFPEYASFKLHPWNAIYLTARQHFVAHLILWKVFGGSQTFALKAMMQKLKIRGKKVTSTLYEQVKIQQALENSVRTRGDGHWSRKPGKIHNFKTNHPRGMKSKKHSEESKKAIGAKQIGPMNHFFGKSHDENTKQVIREKAQSQIWITNGIDTQRVAKSAEIPQGWRRGRSQGTMSSRIWITDGIIDRTHPKDQPLPPGFGRGRTKCNFTKR